MPAEIIEKKESEELLATGKRKTNNIYDNYIDSAALDDIEALEEMAY